MWWRRGAELVVGGLVSCRGQGEPVSGFLAIWLFGLSKLGHCAARPSCIAEGAAGTHRAPRPGPAFSGDHVANRSISRQSRSVASLPLGERRRRAGRPACSWTFWPLPFGW